RDLVDPFGTQGRCARCGTENMERFAAENMRPPGAPAQVEKLRVGISLINYLIDPILSWPITERPSMSHQSSSVQVFAPTGHVLKKLCFPVLIESQAVTKTNGHC